MTDTAAPQAAASAILKTRRAKVRRSAAHFDPNPMIAENGKNAAPAAAVL